MKCSWIIRALIITPIVLSAVIPHLTFAAALKPKSSFPEPAGGLIAATLKPRIILPEKIKVRMNGRYKASSFGSGQCVEYTARRRNGVDFLGNGGEWFDNARLAGYKTGTKPIPGAILVTSEGSVGHTAYVEKVYKDGSFIVSEQNFVGLGVVSKRTIKPNAPFIKGFIF